MKLLQQFLPGGETTAQHAQRNSIPVCIHHLLQLVIENKLGVPVQRRNLSDSTALLDLQSGQPRAVPKEFTQPKTGKTTSHTAFELILVIRTFFSYNQKPKDIIQNSWCCSAVSKEAEHERFLPLFTKTASAQAGSTGWELPFCN